MKNIERIKDEYRIMKEIVEKLRKELDFYGWNSLSEDLRTYYLEKCTILNTLYWVLDGEE
jgi:hypothetical protein